MQAIQEHEELYYRLSLSFVPGIGNKTSRTMLEKFGSATAIFKAPIKELKNTEGVTEIKIKGFADTQVLKRGEQELNYVLKNDIRVLCIKDNYPKRLSNCVDAPTILYYKANADLDAAKIVAIVGTRKNTDYGHKLCEELVDRLKQIDDILIVSGLALGIDAIAHKRCVQQGIPTVGILGHGLDRIYPFTHKGLANQMEENGGILSEFASETAPERGNFPARNRIVAGISDVTVVVESHATGGALITAAMAAGYNREVAAYPGRVTDTRSAGCNELIRNNGAAMITKADDLIELMNWDAKKVRRPVQQQLFITLTPEEQTIIDLLQSRDNVHSDELFHHTGLASSLLAATLLQLEMQGLVKSLPGKYYRMD